MQRGMDWNGEHYSYPIKCMSYTVLMQAVQFIFWIPSVA